MGFLWSATIQVRKGEKGPIRSGSDGLGREPHYVSIQRVQRGGRTQLIRKGGKLGSSYFPTQRVRWSILRKRSHGSAVVLGFVVSVLRERNWCKIIIQRLISQIWQGRQLVLYGMDGLHIFSTKRSKGIECYLKVAEHGCIGILSGEVKEMQERNMASHSNTFKSQN